MLRRNLARIVVAAVLPVVALLAAQPASAVMIKQFSLAELSEQADLIFVGTVAEVTSSWNEERTKIYTDVTFYIDEINGVIKPDGVHEDGGCITLRFLGGRIREEGVFNYISGMPQFEVGERTLLFVDSGSRLCPVLGWEQGKRDPDTPGLIEQIRKYLPGTETSR